MTTDTNNGAGDWLAHRRFVIERINEINQWRNEAVKHEPTAKHRARIDARALQLREKLEGRQ